MNRRKKRAKKDIPARMESVRGKRCVYCGKPLEEGKPSFIAQVRTCSFHTCSLPCKDATERYVRQDKQKKIWLYLMLLACAAGIFVSALGRTGATNLLMYGSIFVAGAGFLLFPYPITSFETFFTCPIRKVTAISRGVGIFFCTFSILLFSLTR